MKIKRVMSLLLALCLVCGLSFSLAAGSAGSASDPLISKSYIDDTYPALVLGDPIEMLKNSMVVLEYKLNQKTSGLTQYTAPSGGAIVVSSGGSFVFLSGTAKLSTLSGTLIDVTDGVTLSAGQSLASSHRYVAGGSTSARITTSSASNISAMGSVSVQSASLTFTDVGTDKWFYDYVAYAVSCGLINGKSDKIFAPDNNLKINEAIKLAACMHQLFNTGSVTLVNGTTTWYRTYLDYAVNNGIVTKSYSNYDAYITRNEFVNIFYSALPGSQYAVINTVSDNAIPDVKTTDTYASKIYAFYRAGILNGKDSNGSFWPDKNILRSEVAAIVTRMFESDLRVSITLR